jgi:tetratricopeptide (TPR) repeat protein
MNHGRGILRRPLRRKTACLSRALEILLIAVGPDHPTAADVHVNIGEFRRAEGDYDEAIRVIGEALRIVRGSPGAEHLRVARVLERLATMFFEGGHFARAHAAAEEAWAIREAAGEKDTESAAHALMNRGNIASSLGDHARAESLQRQAMEIFYTVCGPEHPHTAHGAVNLATVLVELGRYPEARALLEEAIAVQERLIPGHPDLAWSLSALGALLHEVGDGTGARPLLKRAYQIHHDVLGPGHPLVVRAMSSLAGVLRFQGEAAEARVRLEASLRMQEAAYGPDHPFLANTLSLLAGLLFTDLSDPESARAYMVRAHALLEAAFGPGHPETAEALMNLALSRAREAVHPRADQWIARAFAQKGCFSSRNAVQRRHEIAKTVGQNRGHIRNLRDTRRRCAGVLEWRCSGVLHPQSPEAGGVPSEICRAASPAPAIHTRTAQVYLRACPSCGPASLRLLAFSPSRLLAFSPS